MRRFAALIRLLCLTTVAWLPSLYAFGNPQFGSPGPIMDNAPVPSWETVPAFAAPPPAEPGFPVPMTGSQPLSAAPADVMPGSPISSQPLFSDTIYRSRAWRAEIGIVPGGKLHVTDGFANWPHDPIYGTRFTAGYETDHGWGTRFRLSVLGQTWRMTGSGAIIDITASSGSVDFYKRFFLESTEVVLGTGIGTGELTLRVEDRESDFSSGGATAFTELWHPMLRFRRWDIGFAARARLTITTGSWEETMGGGTIDETDHDTMTNSEIAWGLEARRRFGALQDHYWYFMLLAETQSYQSPWLTANTGSAATFSGLNLTVGIAY
jgi:hypothetical protein